MRDLLRQSRKLNAASFVNLHEDFAVPLCASAPLSRWGKVGFALHDISYITSA